MTSREHKRSFILVFLFYTTVLLGTFGETGYSAIQKLNCLTPWFYDYGWDVTTVLNSGITVLWWSAVWPAWVQFQTRLTAEGVIQPRFWGERRIRWHEIDTIELESLIIIVVSAETRIQIESIYAETFEHNLTIFRQYLPAEMVPTFSYEVKQ